MSLRKFAARGLLLVVFTLALPARAHDRGTSYSTWSIRERTARVSVRIAQLEITRFPWAAEALNGESTQLTSYFPDNLVLIAGETICPLASAPVALPAADGQLGFEWTVRCPQQGALAVRSSILLEVSPGHLHFAKVRRDDQRALEKVLSESDPIWELSAHDNAAPEASSVASYVALGVEHILSGWDHLAFVLALLLLAGSFSEVARIVTGFTIAHSLTLALMALGYLQPAAEPVEALIGLSIALVAIENVWQRSTDPRRLRLVLFAGLGGLALAAGAGRGAVPALSMAGVALFTVCYFELLGRVGRPETLRWAIAFVFGLVHGFGFASVLGEAGLPRERLVPALFGFNVGVELGQLLVVALIVPVLRVTAQRAPGMHRTILEGGSAAICGLGLYWFTLRAFGP